MASSTLIGTAPDQVPTNGDLGDLAFQNKEFVEFYDGRGGLSHLNITAISRQLSVSATDVFVYDTSKDSDGGAWRNRCQHTSWYNETLNTATRGSRREFPSVAVIVATTSTVTIYDGDQPDLPMWMVFTANGTSNWYGSNTPVTCVSFLNGIMTVGTGSTGGGVRNASFVADKFVVFYTISGIGPAGGISNRNSAVNWSGDPYIVIINAIVNDVAMTVLPNAPIDAATGLPIPTIAVATSSGISVINNDDTVATLRSGSNTYGVYFNYLKELVCSINDESSTFDIQVYPSYATSIASAASRKYYHQGAGVYSTPPLSGTSTEGVCRAITSFSPTTVAFSCDATTKGRSALNLVAENPLAPTQGMVSYIASTYNTGWMPGNIKGAWLSDITQETVVGAELVTNGTFASNIAGWSDLYGTNISWSSSGYLHINNPYGTATRTGCIQSFATVVGRTYTASAVLVSNNGYVRIGSGGAWSDQTALSYTGVISFTFVATSTSSDVRVDLYRTSYSVSADVDNISVRLADADRSVNNKGLQVFGNITKTPVAAGADLVGYSGFSASNYLLQPYNSSFDFGTGDFSVTGWFNVSSTSGTQYLFERCVSGDPNSKRIEAFVENGYVKWYAGNGTLLGQAAIYASNWYQFTYVKRGGVYYGYLNGALVFANAKTQDHSDVGAPLLFGTRAWSVGSTPLSSGALAMWRISATAPSAEQITKMYNDEKVLFQDNAKATLYGTSDAVTALAYDKDTNLLHVGTSSGRSVFNGLRRVDNTTDAVGACISAADGLVVED